MRAAVADRRRRFATPLVAALALAVVAPACTGNGALSGTDGERPEPRWEFTEDDFFQMTGRGASDGEVAVVEMRHNDVSMPNRLYAFDLESGDEQWKVDLAQPDPSLLVPPVIAKGRVFFLDAVGDGATLHAVDLDSGKELWKHEGVGRYTPQLAAAGNRVALFSGTLDDNTLVMYEASSGEVRDETPVADSDVLYLAAVGDSIIVGDVLGNFRAMDGNSQRWTIPALPVDPDRLTTAGFVVRDGFVLVPSLFGMVAIDGTKGTVTPLDDTERAGDAFIVGGTDLASYDLATGTEQWRVTPKDLGAIAILDASPAAGGAIVARTDQALVTLDAATGEVEGSYKLSNELPVDRAFTTGLTTFYVADANNPLGSERALGAVDVASSVRLWRTSGGSGEFEAGVFGGTFLVSDHGTLLAF